MDDRAIATFERERASSSMLTNTPWSADQRKKRDTVLAIGSFLLQLLLSAGNRESDHFAKRIFLSSQSETGKTEPHKLAVKFH